MVVVAARRAGRVCAVEAEAGSYRLQRPGRQAEAGAQGLRAGRDGQGPEPNQPNTINTSCADGTSGIFHDDESNDRLKLFTNDGSFLGPGKLVTLQATVWAYTTFSSDKLELFAKAGLFAWEAKASDTTGGVPFSDKINGTGLSLGLGANYFFTKSVGARVEWEHFELDPGSAGLLSAGIIVKF